MNTRKSVLFVWAILFAVVNSSCKKEKNLPLGECVTACLGYINKLENLYQTQGDRSFEGIKNGPKSITVPTGTNVMVIVGWNFDEYKNPNAKVSKIYVKTSAGGNEVECELIDEGNSNGKERTFPAYQNTTFYVRIVVDNGEEFTVGPLTVNVTPDNKLLDITPFSDNQYLCVNYDSILYYHHSTCYLFAPYYHDAGQRGHYVSIEAIKAPGENLPFPYEYTSPQVALFTFTRQNLPLNQVKIVAADKIQSSGLYPELTAKAKCDLGFNYARFLPWNGVTYDSSTGFYNDPYNFFTPNCSITYNDLDTMSFTNAAPELIVDKHHPGFKFITNAGKKGVGVVSLSSDGKTCNLNIRMQR